MNKNIGGIFDCFGGISQILLYIKSNNSKFGLACYIKQVDNEYPVKKQEVKNVIKIINGNKYPDTLGVTAKNFTPGGEAPPFNSPLNFA